MPDLAISATPSSLNLNWDCDVENWQTQVDITPSSPVTVEDGVPVDIIVTPKSGYHFADGDSVGNVKSSNKLNIDVTESNAQIKSVTVENVHDNWEDWVGVGANKSLYIENNFDSVNGGKFAPSAGGSATIGGNFTAKNGDAYKNLLKVGKGSLSVLGKTTANQINVWKDSENNSGSLEFNETDIKDSISIEDGNVTFNKVANAPTVNFSGNHAVFRQGVNGNFNLKNHETNDVTPEAILYLRLT